MAAAVDATPRLRWQPFRRIQGCSHRCSCAQTCAAASSSPSTLSCAPDLLTAARGCGPPPCSTTAALLHDDRSADVGWRLWWSKRRGEAWNAARPRTQDGCGAARRRRRRSGALVEHPDDLLEDLQVLDEVLRARLRLQAPGDHVVEVLQLVGVRVL